LCYLLRSCDIGFSRCETPLSFMNRRRPIPGFARSDNRATPLTGTSPSIYLR
jgi:hypothetical protein